MRIAAPLPCPAIPCLFSQRTARLFVFALAVICASWPTMVRGEEPSALAAAIAMEKMLVESIEKAERSVVAIGLFERIQGPSLRGLSNVRSEPDRPDLDVVPDKYGTGVVIGERLILTNHHVVLNEEPSPDLNRPTFKFIRVAGHSQWIRVYIKAADPRTDLAVLEIPQTETGAPKLQPIKFVDAKTRVKKGQIVVSLGNPYAIASDGQVCASWGIVSNVGRRIPKKEFRDATKLRNLGGLIQTDAKLNLGTSGGALINLRGEMVGLTTSLAAAAGFETPAGYAIAVDDAFRNAVKQMSEGREVEHALIGVYPAETVTTGGGATHGVLVNGVVDGVAAKGPLQEDDIITHINNQRVRQPMELMYLVGQQPAGAMLSVRRERRSPVDGQWLAGNVAVQLNKYPVRGTKIVTNPRPSWRGLHVDFPREILQQGPVNPFERFPASASRFLLSDALLITKVEPDSPAAQAGLDEGQLIYSVDGQRLAGLNGSMIALPDVFLKLAEPKQGPVELQVASPGLNMSLAKVLVQASVTPEAAGATDASDGR